MCSISQAIRVVAIAGVLFASRSSHAQNAGVSPKGEVDLLKLAKPTYPPLAKQTRIAGDVEVYVEVGRDGSIETASVIQGHPLLAQAALDSTRHSEFQCTECRDIGSPYRLVFRFALDPDRCRVTYRRGSRKQDASQVTKNANLVTVFAVPACVDHLPLKPVMGDDGRERAIKCLYLWRCGPPQFFRQ